MRDYKIITLCGSVKFKDEFDSIQLKLSLLGNVVLSLCSFNKNSVITEDEIKILGEVHKRKIDLSDEIFVINKNGYIGKSTKNEIEYATKHNKKINYLESIN